MKSCFSVFLVVFILSIVSANPALEIHEKIERGGIKGFPYSPLFCRSTVEITIGHALEAYPCTEEPYYIHVHIKNARHEPHTILPYNSFWESRNGDFFNIYLRDDPSVKAKYIGPVSTHVFPPPQENIDDFVILLPAKIVSEEGKTEYLAEFHFEFDAGKNYEFPQNGIYRSNPDIPLLFYDPETKEFNNQRLWGTTRYLRAHYAEECKNSRVTVNEIREETEYQSCSDDQIKKISSAIDIMRNTATEAKKALQDPTAASVSPLLREWFGDEGTNTATIEKLNDVYEKLVSLIPSVIQCEESSSYLLDGSTVEDRESLDRFLYHYFEEEEEDEDEDEEENNDKEYEIIDDHTGIKEMTHRCTPGMTSWLIPRDLSSTVHICPAFFDFESSEAAFYLMDSFVRFENVAGAIDYVLGKENARTLASEKGATICLQNAGNYPIFARELSSDNEQVAVDASV